MNSLTEAGTKILSFKIDPADSAVRGPEIISKDFTHFGIYPARLRVPQAGTFSPMWEQ